MHCSQDCSHPQRGKNGFLGGEKNLLPLSIKHRYTYSSTFTDIQYVTGIKISLGGGNSEKKVYDGPLEEVPMKRGWGHRLRQDSSTTFSFFTCKIELNMPLGLREPWKCLLRVWHVWMYEGRCILSLTLENNTNLIQSPDMPTKKSFFIEEKSDL